MLSALGLGLAATIVLGACSYGDDTIRIDGSSTVFPISEAVAEEFMRETKGIRVNVGFSGTGAGFEKFCRGDTQVSAASRAIKESEIMATSAETRATAVSFSRNTRQRMKIGSCVPWLDRSSMILPSLRIGKASIL